VEDTLFSVITTEDSDRFSNLSKGVRLTPGHVGASSFPWDNAFLASTWCGTLQQPTVQFACAKTALQRVRRVPLGSFVWPARGRCRTSAQRDFFNRVPIAAIGGGIAGLPRTPGLHHLSFEFTRELAQGFACVISRGSIPCNRSFMRNATPV
jgi:hypothetical protein